MEVKNTREVLMEMSPEQQAAAYRLQDEKKKSKTNMENTKR